MAITETLELDMGQALAAVQSLRSEVESIRVSVEADVASVAPAVERAVESANAQVEVQADAAPVTAEINTAISSADTIVEVTATLDATQIEGASKDIEQSTAPAARGVASVGKEAGIGAAGIASFGKEALVATGLTVGLAEAIRFSFGAAVEQERVLAQTEARVRSTGGVAGVTAEHVRELAQQIEDLTTIDDKQVQAAENLLLTFCLEESAQALVKGRGWTDHADIDPGDLILTYDPEDDSIRWDPVLSMHRFSVDGDLIRWKSKQIDVATTPHHRWWTVGRSGRAPFTPRFMTTEEISGHQFFVKIGGGWPETFAPEPTWSDDLVELAAWVATEGWFDTWKDQSGPRRQPRLCACGNPARNKSGPARCDECGQEPIQAGRTTPRPKVTSRTSRVAGVSFCQSETANPVHTKRIRGLVARLRAQGHQISESQYVAPYNGSTIAQWRFSRDLGRTIRWMLPGKKITMGLIESLTREQASGFLDVLIAADGHTDRHGHRQFIQKDRGQLDVVAALGAMLGRRTTILSREDSIYFPETERLNGANVHAHSESYEGTVWCPHIRTGIFMARCNGRTFWTGNTKIRNDLGGPIFDKAIQAAADLSVALGSDMTSAALQLGKALNDPINGLTVLGRAGVTFTAQQKETIRGLVESGQTAAAQLIILNEIQTQVGGSAAAVADTLGGKMAQAMDKVEGIALKLAPVFNLIADTLKTLGPIFDAVGFAIEHFGLELAAIAFPPLAPFVLAKRLEQWFGGESVADLAARGTKAINDANASVAQVQTAAAEVRRAASAEVTASIANDNLIAANSYDALAGAMSADVTEIVRANEDASTSTSLLAAKADELNNVMSPAFDKATSVVAAFGSQTEVTAAQVLKFFDDQVAAARNWSANLIELARSGLDQGLLAELEAAGPKAAPLVAAYLQAVKDGNLEAINSSQNDLRTILDSTANEISGFAPRMRQEGDVIGRAIGDGVITGIEARTLSMQAQLTLALNATLDAARISIGALSPSRVFAAQVGEPISEGIAMGITASAETISHAVALSLKAASQEAKDSGFARNFQNEFDTVMATLDPASRIQVLDQLIAAEQQYTDRWVQLTRQRASAVQELARIEETAARDAEAARQTAARDAETARQRELQARGQQISEFERMVSQEQALQQRRVDAVKRANEQIAALDQRLASERTRIEQERVSAFEAEDQRLRQAEDQRRGELERFASISDRFRPAAGISAAQLIRNADEQNRQLSEFTASLAQLRERGVSEAVIGSLGLGAGPQALGQIRRLLAASADEVQRLNASVSVRSELIGTQVGVDTAGTRAEVEAAKTIAGESARAQVEALVREVADQKATISAGLAVTLADLDADAAAIGRSAGATLGLNIAAGLQSTNPVIRQAARDLQTTLVDAGFPSSVTAQGATIIVVAPGESVDAALRARR